MRSLTASMTGPSPCSSHRAAIASRLDLKARPEGDLRRRGRREEEVRREEVEGREEVGWKEEEERWKDEEKSGKRRQT